MSKTFFTLFLSILTILILFDLSGGNSVKSAQKINYLKKLSSGLYEFDFSKKIPIKYKAANYTAYKSLRFGGDMTRIKFKKVSPESYVIIDIQRISNKTSFKDFQLLAYAHGKAANKLKKNIEIKVSPKGVDYAPVELERSKSIKKYGGGRSLFALKPARAVEAFRFIRINLAGITASWQIELDKLFFSEKPLKKFIVVKPIFVPAKIQLKKSVHPKTYPLPYGIRKITHVPEIQGIAFKKNDINPLNHDLNTFEWKTVKYGSQSYKNPSWRIPGSTRKDNCALYCFDIVKKKRITGGRTFLILPASRFVTTVYIDGKELRTFTEGMLPLKLDISKAVAASGKYRIMLKIRNYKAGISESGNLLQPMGAMFKYQCGLSRAPMLLWVSNSYLKEAYIKSFVDKNSVSAEVKIINPANDSLITAEIIYSNGKIIFSKQLKLFGQKGIIKFNFDVDDKLKKWDIGKPNLYKLRFQLYSANKLIDELTTRFGYRTINVKGENIFLNGRKIFLVGPWAHVGEWVYARLGGTHKGPSDYTDLFSIMLKRNINIGRLHCQVYDDIFYNAADEAGFLIIAESNLSHRPKTQISLDHIEQMVKHLRNHPSIIIWSGSNEFEHWISPRPEKTSKFLLQVQEIFHKYDSQRPVQHSGYGDASGKLDIYNIHYPEKQAAEFPRSLYWKHKSAKLPVHYQHNYSTYSPAGEKPIAIGEQMTPTGKCSLEHIFGDKVYIMRRGDVKNLIKYEKYLGDYWREAIRIYREQNIAFLSPNFMYLPDGVDSAFLQIISKELSGSGVYIKELYPALTPGANRRTLLMFDDSGKGFKGTVKLRLEFSTEITWEYEQKVKIAPSSLTQKIINIKLPDTVKDMSGKILVELLDLSGKLSYSMFRDIKLYADLKAPPLGGEIILMSDAPQLQVIFSQMGLGVKIFTGWKNIKANSTLVIPETTSEMILKSSAVELADFVRNGGRVLMLDRLNIPQVFPMDFKLLSGQYPGATAGFIRAPFHPIFSKGFYKFSDIDFRYWADDYLVSKAIMYKPISGNFICLIDGGLKLNGALLTEVPYGQGTIITCQLKTRVFEKHSPVQQRLLYNLAAYLNGNERLHATNIGYFLPGTEPYTSFLLEKLGWKKLNQKNIKNQKFQALFIDGESIKDNGIEKTLQMARNAKFTYLHINNHEQMFKFTKALAGTFPFMQKLLIFKNQKWRPVNIRNAFIVRDPLFDGLSGKDLNWFQRSEKQSFSFISTKQWTVPVYPLRIAVHRQEGKTIIADMSDWNQEIDFEDNRNRFLCSLSTQMGVSLAFRAVRKVSSSNNYKSINLRDACNVSAQKYLGTNFPVGKIIMRDIPYNFIRLGGKQKFSMIRLNSRVGTAFENKKILYDTPIDKFELKTPLQININVNNIHADTLYFAHASTRNWKTYSHQRKNFTVCYYKINYQDGTSNTISIIFKKNINDSREHGKDTRDMMSGTSFLNTANGSGETAAIAIFKWANPHPEKKIKSIDIISNKNIAFDPMIFAITYKEYAGKFQ